MHLTRILASAVKDAPLSRLFFSMNNFYKYGLYQDDLEDDVYDKVVAEAVRRLPPDLYDQRTWRCARAVQLDVGKDYLPKSQWTTFEENITKGAYLQPYIAEVRADLKERAEWEAAHAD